MHLVQLVQESAETGGCAQHIAEICLTGITPMSVVCPPSFSAVADSLLPNMSMHNFMS